ASPFPHRHRLDLDPCPRRQGGHLDRRPRRVWRREVATVDVVHRAELCEVDDVDGGLDDRRERQAGGGENGGKVFAGAGGLGGDAAGDGLACSGVEAHLAGAEDEGAGVDRLGVGTERARGVAAGDTPVAHVRTRATFITPRTRPRLRITRFSSSALATMISKTFCAFRSPRPCTWARAMLMPAELIAFDMAASRPGRSTHVTSTRTGRGAPLPSSQWTSMRRCGSLSSTFGQSMACTVTPRPRVMKPVMRSPGSGPQHFPKRTSMSSTPETRTPLFVCRLTRRRRR